MDGIIIVDGKRHRKLHNVSILADNTEEGSSRIHAEFSGPDNMALDQALSEYKMVGPGSQAHQIP